MTDPSTGTVRVLVDVTGIDKRFDYLVPPDAGTVRVGTEVRVRLGARKVHGWVVAVDVTAPPGVELQAIDSVRGIGPSAELIELSEWAARRWVGHPATFLRVASAPTRVDRLPVRARRVAASGISDAVDGIVDDVLAGGPSVVRLPPLADRRDLVVALAARTMGVRDATSVLVACPSRRAAARLARSLDAVGLPVVEMSEDAPGSIRGRAWARAARGGCIVVGTRNVAWAPAPDPVLAVMIDEHDEAYQSTRTPTWHARDVLAERARRAGVPFVQLSATPSFEALLSSRAVTVPPAVERRGWPHVEVVDRRGEDPRLASSVLSERLGAILAESGRTVCVLNRTGRIRLLACRACGNLVRCEHCGAAVHAPLDGTLRCPRCGTERPRVCAECGSAALKNLRVGVARAREELEALIGEPVDEVTGGRTAETRAITTRVVIGTEAVLHRTRQVDTIVFLDIDQELTAPRFRAAEQALVLLSRAARLIGARTAGRRLVIQTRLLEHPVLGAVVAGDPSRVVDAELPLRAALGFPPYTALALVSGAGAGAFVSGVDPEAVEVLDGGDGTWLIRAPDHDALSRGLVGVPRPEQRVRIEVDPLRV